MKKFALVLMIALGLSASPALAQDTAPPDPPIGAVELAGEPELPSAVPTPGPAPATTVVVSDVEAPDSQGQPAEAGDAKKGAAEVDIGDDIYAAFEDGKWVVLAGLVLLLLVRVARPMAGAWGKTRAGGYALAYGVPLIGALGLSLSTGRWGIEVFLGALSAGLASMGLHGQAKDVAESAT